MIEPMAEESADSLSYALENLNERSLATLKLVISDVHAGLTVAIRKSFSEASWQRCKLQLNLIFLELFLRTFLSHSHNWNRFI